MGLHRPPALARLFLTHYYYRLSSHHQAWWSFLLLLVRQCEQTPLLLHRPGPARPMQAVFNFKWSTMGDLLHTGACTINRICAQQYVGKSQSCMVISGRLIVHAPVINGTCDKGTGIQQGKRTSRCRLWVRTRPDTYGCVFK